MEQTSLNSHFTWLNLFTYINSEKQVLISCIPPARRAGWFSIKIPWRISLSKVPVLTKREYQSTHAFDSNFWSKCSSAVAFQVRSGVWAERRCSWRCTQWWTEKARGRLTAAMASTLPLANWWEHLAFCKGPSRFWVRKRSCIISPILYKTILFQKL